MTSDELPTPIRELIAQHIRSMDHAEAALILAGERDRAHSVADVAEQQRWAKGTALDILDALTSSGLAVRTDDGYRLSGDVPGTTMAALAALYHTRPVTLVSAIYATPLPVAPLLRTTRRDEQV